MPALFAVGVSVVVPASDNQWAGYFPLVAIWISALATAWWTKGLFWLSRRCYRERRLAQAALALGFGCSALWFLAMKAIVMATLITLHFYQTQADKADCASGRVRFPQPAQVVIDGNGQRLRLSGPIGNGSTASLALALAKNPKIALLELDSPGGYVDEAKAMRELLELKGIDTLVIRYCASACTDVFLGGNRRYVALDANFGFHQSGHCGKDAGDLSWGEREHEIATLFREKKVQRKFALMALGTSYFSLWQPSAVDVKDSGFATDWWSFSEEGSGQQSR